MTHLAGTKNTQANPLSRWPNHAVSTGTFGPMIFNDIAAQHVRYTTAQRHLSTDELAKLILQYDKDIAESAQASATEGSHGYGITKDGSILKKERKVVPSNQEVIGKVIKAHHDVPSAGHPGVEKTREYIQRSYWWNMITDDVKHYVEACTICQKLKPDNRKHAALLHPNPIPSCIWENVSVDFINNLPLVESKDSILVFVDMKSKAFVSILVSAETLSICSRIHKTCI